MQLSALHRLFAGLVRRTWLVTLVAVIACAAFAARAVAALVEADYLTDDHRAPAAPPAPQVKKPTPPPAQIDGRVLVDRNIFCSECVAAVPSGPVTTDAPYSGLPVVLIATSLGEEATATLHVPSTGAQGSYGLGDSIPGVGTIARIGAVSIDVVDANMKRGRISLLDAAAGRTGPGAATPVAAAAPAAARPFADRINKINDTTFEVERGLVRDLVTGVSNGGGVRAFPVMEKDQIKGLRLAGVKPGSVAAELGLRSSDMVNTIDGEQIKNVQQLLDLYAKIDNLNSVDIGVVRGGKPMSLQLRLK